MVSHIVQRVKGEDPYMEDFNLTISRPFIKGVGPIEKQNHRGGEGGWGLGAGGKPVCAPLQP